MEVVRRLGVLYNITSKKGITMETFTSLLNADYFSNEDGDLEFNTEYRKKYFEATVEEFDKVVEFIDRYAQRVNFNGYFLDTDDPNHGEPGEKNLYAVDYDDMTILLVAESQSDANWIMDGMESEINELLG